jgi:cation transport regulator
MPYQSNSDLPANISSKLPERAQTIFRKAFNAAHEQYKDEQTAFKVAWAAVKHEYEKDAQGVWVKK